jgi:hypothetical protein
MLRFVASVASLALAYAQFTTSQSWEAEYGSYRSTDSVGYQEWRDSIPVPAAARPPLGRHQSQTVEERREGFYQCIEDEARVFTSHAMRYRSPKLEEVRSAVRAELDKRGMGVTVAVFWGRNRYVRILWPYLKRNLRRNGGVIDHLLLLQANQTWYEGAVIKSSWDDGNRDLLAEMAAYDPEHIKYEPFCEGRFGCAYDEVLTNKSQVYVKLDDDIVFVKDGSFEHLVLETVANDEYTFYLGNVVNNPHSAAVHRFTGSYPGSSYHWSKLGRTSPPFYESGRAPVWYYGLTIYEDMGAPEHEAFVYNVAMNKLQVYAFDIWNMNGCRCAEKQDGFDLCDERGYYRWDPNAISWLYAKSSKFPHRLPNYEIPFVTAGWASSIAPNRAGMVGESLFVHAASPGQRQSSYGWGGSEKVLLPFWRELAAQYTSGSNAFGGWQGNRSLLLYYEAMHEASDSRRGSGNGALFCMSTAMELHRQWCPKPWTW